MAEQEVDKEISYNFLLNRLLKLYIMFVLNHMPRKLYVHVRSQSYAKKVVHNVRSQSYAKKVVRTCSFSIICQESCT